MAEAVDAHLARAREHLRQRRPDAARDILAGAAARYPTDPRLRHLLAGVDLGLGRPGEAMEGFLSVLRQGKDLDLRRDCARHIGALLSRPGTATTGTLGMAERLSATDFLRCLGDSGGDPQPFGIAALSLIKATEWKPILELGRAKGWRASARRLLTSKAGRLLDGPLVRAALCRTINMDPEIELLLTALRREILFARRLPVTIQRFLPVLAIQAWLNQYIFDETDGETIEIDRRLAKPAVAMKDRARLALYRPMDDIGLDPKKLRGAEWRLLHDLSVREPKEEIDIAGKLPSLTPLPPESEPVRAQYEAAPYPRWREIPMVAPGERRRLLSRFAPERAWDGDLQILIAGCGTGRQALVAARGYGEEAKVTAVDVSRRSLGHAALRAGDFGAPSPRLALADIMAIGHLDQRFDVIECFGVLHHLPDPLEGWRQLTRLLADAGIMQVALYRNAGRRHCAAARARIAEMGLGSGPADIRRFRRHVLANGGQAGLRELLSIGDFYSMSGCRDLMFHARERDYELEEIGAALDHLDLEFLGLQVPFPVQRRFSERFKESQATRSFDAWMTFETENPGAFDALYRFWCRRRRGPAEPNT